MGLHTSARATTPMVPAQTTAPVECLQQHWGFNEFRTNQLEAIQATLSGQDCLLVSFTLGHTCQSNAAGSQTTPSSATCRAAVPHRPRQVRGLPAATPHAAARPFGCCVTLDCPPEGGHLHSPCSYSRSYPAPQFHSYLPSYRTRSRQLWRETSKHCCTTAVCLTPRSSACCGMCVIPRAAPACSTPRPRACRRLH